MRHRLFVFVMFWVFVPLLCLSLFGQGTIQIEATDAMPVCSASQPASPCATAPRPISKPAPLYSEQARKSHREGVVTLGLVVDSDGSTRDIHVVKSVGDGLDEQAIDAVRQWKFEPGTYQEKPVPVQLNIEISFRFSANSSSASGEARASEALNGQIRNLFADAQSAYGRHDYQTAANLARRLTSLAARNSNGWNLLGISLLELHELDQAASALETAVKLDPASPFAYNNLGRVYWRQRKYDEAIAQFQKQVALNPQDQYAHANLGMVLRDQKKCSLALPELEKALLLTPNNATVMVTLGECDLDLGNTAKGISELEQATSEASSPAMWNSAAYKLARRNTELERAQKWSESAIAGESAQLHNISLDHLSTAQLSRVTAIASYWDTLGWILFQRGNRQQAAQYTEAAWSLRPLPVIGSHLGKIYEALGRQDDATHAYAMAVAAADSPLIQPLSTEEAESVAEATEKLTQAASRDKPVSKLVEQARYDLTAARQISVPNIAKASGSTDFTLNIAASGKSVQIHQVSGDSSFAPFAKALQSVSFPWRIPSEAQIEIPRRGTLTCSAGKSECAFVVLSADDAVDLSRKESAADTAVLAQLSAEDPHTYNNPAIGMKVSLPEDWQLIKEESGSFSHPHNAILGKPGALAFFLLTRERVEGSADLYRKMLDTGLSRREEFRRTGEMEVKRDGIPGTRWNIGWKEQSVTYVGITEFFSVGDDHYRITASAPAEVYSRYSQNFEDMLRSLRFPMLHNDPKIFDNP